MKKNKTTYKIGDINNKYDIFPELNHLHEDIQDKFQEKPIQESELSLAIIKNSNRISHYRWEMYQIKDSLLMIECFGTWKGYSHESPEAPKIKYSEMHKLKITIHNPDKIIEESIDELISKYELMYEKIQ